MELCSAAWLVPRRVLGSRRVVLATEVVRAQASARQHCAPNSPIARRG